MLRPKSALYCKPNAIEIIVPTALAIALFIVVNMLNGRL